LTNTEEIQRMFNQICQNLKLNSAGFSSDQENKDQIENLLMPNFVLIYFTFEIFGMHSGQV
jgi:hypothetical protein